MPKRSIMNGAIIRIRDSKNREESKNKLIAMLEVLLSSTKKKKNAAARRLWTENDNRTGRVCE